MDLLRKNAHIAMQENTWQSVSKGLLTILHNQGGCDSIPGFAQNG